MNMNTASTTTPSSNMLSVPSSTSSSSGIDINNPTRPAFNSQRTQDRLREGEGLYAMLFRSDSNKLQRGRKSVFKETGLDDDSASEVARRIAIAFVAHLNGLVSRAFSFAAVSVSQAGATGIMTLFFVL
ncbi:hypothetical protein Trisim1_006299 [Trichoderma cf. simile WF8]